MKGQSHVDCGSRQVEGFGIYRGRSMISIKHKGASSNFSAATFTPENKRIRKSRSTSPSSTSRSPRSSKAEKFHAISPASTRRRSSSLSWDFCPQITGFDLVAHLPREVALAILGFLKPVDLLKATQTSSIWRKLAEDNFLWRDKCKEVGVSYCLNSYDLQIIQRRTKMNSFIYSPWKANFLKLYRIEMNFRFNEPKVLTAEEDFISSEVMEFFDHKIIYRQDGDFDDFALYVVCAISGKRLHKLRGHTNRVMSVQMNSHVIVSGSRDKTMKVWSLDTGSCLHTMLGHSNSVSCMQMYGGIVVSGANDKWAFFGSRDTSVRMWDVRRGVCLRVLTGHLNPVQHVQYDGRLVVSASSDYHIKIWDSDTGECLRTLVDHKYCSFLKFNGHHVVTSTQEMREIHSSTRVWDVDTGVCRHNMEGYAAHVQMCGSKVVGVSGEDERFRVFDILTGSCLYILEGDEGLGVDNCVIHSMQLNNKFVVVGFIDGIRLWDVETGEFIRHLLMPASVGMVVGDIFMKDSMIVCHVQEYSPNKEYLGEKLLVLNFDTNDV